MNLTAIIKLLNEQYSLYHKMPEKVKFNEEWYRMQNFSTWTLKDSAATFNGIPIEFDNTIDTYQFVYKK